MVRRVEPQAPVEIRTLDTVVGNTIARPRALSILVAVFALVGLALAAIGVYGVMVYSVRERTQEIGVRMALGATQQSVARLIVGQALRLVLVGVAIGLAAAMLLTRSLESLLYDVEPLDPWTFAGNRNPAAGDCDGRRLRARPPRDAHGADRGAARQLSESKSQRSQESEKSSEKCTTAMSDPPTEPFELWVRCSPSAS